ncbi:hypothetical protein DIPPA_18693 [Diplonema papillatum]|nr:hypothetical protein DIPPA_18693 [Diplonema papillatum]
MQPEGERSLPSLVAPLDDQLPAGPPSSPVKSPSEPPRGGSHHGTPPLPPLSQPATPADAQLDPPALNRAHSLKEPRPAASPGKPPSRQPSFNARLSSEALPHAADAPSTEGPHQDPSKPASSGPKDKPVSHNRRGSAAHTASPSVRPSRATPLGLQPPSAPLDAVSKLVTFLPEPQTLSMSQQATERGTPVKLPLAAPPGEDERGSFASSRASITSLDRSTKDRGPAAPVRQPCPAEGEQAALPSGGSVVIDDRDGVSRCTPTPSLLSRDGGSEWQPRPRDDDEYSGIDWRLTAGENHRKVESLTREIERLRASYANDVQTLRANLSEAEREVAMYRGAARSEPPGSELGDSRRAPDSSRRARPKQPEPSHAAGSPARRPPGEDPEKLGKLQGEVHEMQARIQQFTSLLQAAEEDRHALRAELEAKQQQYEAKLDQARDALLTAAERNFETDVKMVETRKILRHIARGTDAGDAAHSPQAGHLPVHTSSTAGYPAVELDPDAGSWRSPFPQTPRVASEWGYRRAKERWDQLPEGRSPPTRDGSAAAAALSDSGSSTTVPPHDGVLPECLSFTAKPSQAARPRQAFAARQPAAAQQAAGKSRFGDLFDEVLTDFRHTRRISPSRDGGATIDRAEFNRVSQDAVHALRLRPGSLYY